jgi:hypothetical protein
MKTKPWKIALNFGLPFTVFMIVTRAIQDDGFTLIGMISSMIGGIFVGFGFAFSMKYYAKWLYKKIIIEMQNGEELIKEGGANHFKGIEGVGGKLVLTDKRLVFKSHKINIQNHETDFDIRQIEKVQATRTLGMLNNGLILGLINSDEHRFVVDDPLDWVKEIIIQKNVTI